MLIIFDCDGVLIDSEVIAMDVEHAALTRLGLTWTLSEAIERLCGVPTRDIGPVVEPFVGPLPADFIDTVEHEKNRRLATEVRAIDGVAAVLSTLPYPKCVASSSDVAHLHDNLGRTGLLPLVAPHVFSAAQVRRSKPAPDVFLHALAQMGYDPAEALVIEDSVNGVTAARRAGLRAIGFVGGSHAFPALTGRLMAAGALDVVSHMRDVPAAIARYA